MKKSFYLLSNLHVTVLKNIALNKTSISSAVRKSRNGSLATDGTITGSRESCFTTQKVNRPWWMVNLGAKAVIKKVSIWSVLSEKKVNIHAGFYHGHNGNNNPFCVQAAKLVSSRRNDYICPAQTLAQYVSVIAYNNVYLRLCEVEVYGWYTQ